MSKPITTGLELWPSWELRKSVMGAQTVQVTAER